MVASLYPSPLDVDEALEVAGLEQAAAQQTTQKLSGGQTQRVRFAVAIVANPALLILDEPTVAMDVEGRRAFWAGDARATRRGGKTVLFATHYLEEADANADRAVLMAHGRDRRRRPDHRDQGSRRHAHDPRDAPGRRDRRARAASPGSAPPSATATRSSLRVLGLRPGDPRTAASAIRRPATSRSPAPGSRTRSCALTGDPDDDERAGAGRDRGVGAMSAVAYTRYELLRTVRERRLLLFGFGFPLVLYFVIAVPQPAHQGLRRHRHQRAAVLHGLAGVVRDDDVDGLDRRADRRRAPGGWTRQLRITPLSAACVPPREGAHRLRDGGRSASRCCTSGRAARRAACRPASGSR